MIIGCGEATLTQTGSGIALLRERFKEQRSRMLTAEKRAQILPVWAGFASVIAIDFLTSNFWTALLIGACVGGSVVLARALDDAKQWIIRKTRTKVSAYEQIYQAHVRVDQVINADAPVDAEGSAIMGHPWTPKVAPRSGAREGRRACVDQSAHQHRGRPVRQPTGGRQQGRVAGARARRNR